MILLALVVIIFFSITIHEYAHGWVAYKLGDPTPKVANRLTLNPIAHIDLFGTVLMPIALFIATAAVGRPFTLGYAKPIPINPYNFKNSRKDLVWVGLAGPLANFSLACLLSFALRLHLPDSLAAAVKFGVIINLVLCVFNLLPVPPLDGSKVAAYFLPYKSSYRYLRGSKYGFIIILILVWSGFLRWFIFPLIEMLMALLGVTNVFN